MKVGDILTMPDGERRRILAIDGNTLWFRRIPEPWLTIPEPWPTPRWFSDLSKHGPIFVNNKAREDAGEGDEE